MDVIECPKCGKKTIVRRSSNLYQCISCDFQRDFSEPKLEEPEGTFPWFWIVGGAIATLFLI